MNIIKELPEDKEMRKSTNTEKSSSMYNLFSSTADSVVSVAAAAPSKSTTATSSSSSGPTIISSSGESWSLGFFYMKTWIIIILLVLVVFSYYGIQLLNIFGDAINNGVNNLSPIFKNFLELLGYSTGTALNKTADLTADVAKTGIDVAEGTVQNIGNLMIGDEAVGKSSKHVLHEPEPDSPEDTIQKSLSSSKTKWCLVGEYQNKRGCIDISESDKCMSGQVFPNEEMCLNPSATATKNP